MKIFRTPLKVGIAINFIIFALAFSYQIILQLHWNKTLFGHICDDAYISLVYAKNFSNGFGLVYNLGEHVEGYTNFLWVLIMSIPYFFGVDPIFFIKLTASLFSLVLIVSTYYLARCYFPYSISIILSLSIAFSNHIAYMTTWGLETVFYISLYVLAILYAEKKAFFISGILFALAMMTRMEAILIYGTYVIWLTALSIHRGNYQRLRLFLIAGGLPFSIYFLFRLNYYGYLLPNTFYAKVGGSNKLLIIERGLNYIWVSLKGLGIREVFLFSLLCLLVFGIQFFITKSRKFNWRSSKTPLVGTLFLYLLYIVWVGGDVFLERFIVHTMPLLAICSIIFVRLLSKLIRLPAVLPKVTAVAFACGLTMLGTVSYPISTHLMGWVTLGKYLKNNSINTAHVLATDAAGALKYYSELPTIDILGLNNVHIAHRNLNIGAGVAGHEKQDNGYVLAQKPYYITTWIDEDGGAGRNFKKHFDFRTIYQPFLLLDTSSSQENQNRLVLVTGRDECYLATQAKRDKRPIWDWGVYIRKQNLPVNSTLELLPSDFFAPDSSFLGNNCEKSYIVKVNNYNGNFLYGPYLTLSKGKYHVTINGVISNQDTHPVGDAILLLEIFDGEKALQSSTLASNQIVEDTAFEVTLPIFEWNQVTENSFQIRLFSLIKQNIKVRTIKITQDIY